MVIFKHILLVDDEFSGAPSLSHIVVLLRLSRGPVVDLRTPCFGRLNLITVRLPSIQACSSLYFSYVVAFFKIKQYLDDTLKGLRSPQSSAWPCTTFPFGSGLAHRVQNERCLVVRYMTIQDPSPDRIMLSSVASVVVQDGVTNVLLAIQANTRAGNLTWRPELACQAPLLCSVLCVCVLSAAHSLLMNGGGPPGPTIVFLMAKGACSLAPASRLTSSVLRLSLLSGCSSTFLCLTLKLIIKLKMCCMSAYRRQSRPHRANCERDLWPSCHPEVQASWAVVTCCDLSVSSFHLGVQVRILPNATKASAPKVSVCCSCRCSAAWPHT